MLTFFGVVLEKLKELSGEKSLLTLADGDRDLNLAIALVQILSDAHLSGQSIFVPDITGVLFYSPELVYNNAPWVPPSTLSKTGQQIRFVHSKISNDVADKVGVQSLTKLLLEHNCDVMDIDIENTEAFGQHESLTSRLKHILEMYPDGPGKHSLSRSVPFPPFLSISLPFSLSLSLPLTHSPSLSFVLSLVNSLSLLPLFFSDNVTFSQVFFLNSFRTRMMLALRSVAFC